MVENRRHRKGCQSVKFPKFQILNISLAPSFSIFRQILNYFKMWFVSKVLIYLCNFLILIFLCTCQKIQILVLATSWFRSLHGGGPGFCFWQNERTYQGKLWLRRTLIFSSSHHPYEICNIHGFILDVF